MVFFSIFLRIRIHTLHIDVCHIFIKKDKYVCIGVCSICQLDRGNMFELNGNKYVRIVPEGDLDGVELCGHAMDIIRYGWQ